MSSTTPDPRVHDDFVASLIDRDRAQAELYLRERGLSVVEWERHRSAGPAVEHPSGTFATVPAPDAVEEAPAEAAPSGDGPPPAQPADC